MNLSHTLPAGRAFLSISIILYTPMIIADNALQQNKDKIDRIMQFWGGGGAHPLFAAFCRCRVGRFAAMIAAKSGKFYTIFTIVLSLNKQVLPKILFLP